VKFEYAITVRSRPDLAADYRRALERVAFFPGVTEANLVGEEVGSVTIGYNGHECEKTSRKFCSDLEADGLMADRPLWAARAEIDGRIESNSIVLVRNQIQRRYFQSLAIVRSFDRRS
jgi:hypothetical protein